MSKKLKKGAVKKVAPKLIAKNNFVTKVNGVKYQGLKGQAINCSDKSVIDHLTKQGLAE